MRWQGVWLLPAGLALLLGGCGGDDGEVLTVRAAPWGAASGVSIGQVLQDRSACARSSWRSVVVLPAPLRPSSMVGCPRGTARSTPCRM